MSAYYNGTSAYNLGNVAYDFNKNNVQENIARRQQVRVDKKAAFVNRVRLCLAFIGVFAVAFGLVFTNAMIIEKSSTAADMQQQLNEKIDANNKLAVNIEKNLDLKKIEEIAINELGMKRPDKYQIVYVNVKQNDYAEVTKENSKESKASKTIDAIGKGVGGFVEYIN